LTGSGYKGRGNEEEVWKMEAFVVFGLIKGTTTFGVRCDSRNDVIVSGRLKILDLEDKV